MFVIQNKTVILLKKCSGVAGSIESEIHGYKCKVSQVSMVVCDIFSSSNIQLFRYRHEVKRDWV